MVQPHIRLGDLLVEVGRLTEENLHYVLEEQRSTKRRLGQLLIDKGFLSEEELLQVLARQFNLEILPPEAMDSIEPRPLKLVGEEPLATIDDPHISGGYHPLGLLEILQRFRLEQDPVLVV